MQSDDLIQSIHLQMEENKQRRYALEEERDNLIADKEFLEYDLHEFENRKQEMSEEKRMMIESMTIPEIKEKIETIEARIREIAYVLIHLSHEWDQIGRKQ